jgi:hypothetical protein
MPVPQHPLAPSATIAKVKKWAAERKFGMSEEEEGEHALQITGTHERPAPNIHIGSLVSHPQEKCRRQLAVAALPDCGAAPG